MRLFITEAAAILHFLDGANFEPTTSNVRRLFAHLIKNGLLAFTSNRCGPTSGFAGLVFAITGQFEDNSGIATEMPDVEVPHDLEFVEPLLVSYFCLCLMTDEEKAQYLIESVLSSRRLFKIAEAFLHEAVFRTLVSLLLSAIASTDEDQ